MIKTTLLFVLTAAVTVCRGQEFEVASIARTEPNSMKNMAHNKNEPTVMVEPTIVRMADINLAAAIRWAYGLKTYELVGQKGETWSEGNGMPQLYYIEGHFSAPAKPAEVKIMLQNLLTERFGLVFHTDKRGTKVNFVKLGPNGLSKTMTPSDQPPPQKNVVLQLSSSKEEPGQLCVKVENATIAEIVNELSRIARTPIVDSTELRGRYNAVWKIDMTTAKTPTGLPDAIFASLEQLGLKVFSGKATLDVMVVDQASKLKEN